MMQNDKSVCAMCDREGLILTFHHLIPRTLHSKKWYIKKYSKEELNDGIYVCEDCHEALHDFISEKDLGKNFNTLNLLLEHSKVKNFIVWIKKQKAQRNKTCRSKT